jgi:hypothetical protein
VKIGCRATPAKLAQGNLVHACGKMLRNRENGEQILQRPLPAGEKPFFPVEGRNDFIHIARCRLVT